MHRVLVTVNFLVRNDEGQDLLEYGLLAVLIALGAILAVGSLGGAVNSVLWQTIVQNF